MSDHPCGTTSAVQGAVQPIARNLRRVVLMEALPVNAGGKVLKRELRERHQAGTDDVVTNERSE